MRRGVWQSHRLAEREREAELARHLARPEADMEMETEWLRAQLEFEVSRVPPLRRRATRRVRTPRRPRSRIPSKDTPVHSARMSVLNDSAFTVFAYQRACARAFLPRTPSPTSASTHRHRAVPYLS